jgi:hypothetical protein
MTYFCPDKAYRSEIKNHKPKIPRTVLLIIGEYTEGRGDIFPADMKISRRNAPAYKDKGYGRNRVLQ